MTENSDVYSFGVVILKPAHRQGIWRRGIHCLLGLTHVNDRENVLKVLGEEMASDSVQEDMIKTNGKYVVTLFDCSQDCWPKVESKAPSDLLYAPL